MKATEGACMHLRENQFPWGSLLSLPTTAQAEKCRKMLNPLCCHRPVLLMRWVTGRDLITDTRERWHLGELSLQGDIWPQFCGLMANGRSYIFAFFINSELPIAFIFSQVKRTSGLQGTVGWQRLYWPPYSLREQSFPPLSILDRLSWQHTATISWGKKHVFFQWKNCNRKKE